MKLIRSLACASLVMAFSGQVAVAADYFISPVKSGPVAGTALAAISLQASTTQQSRLQLNINQLGNTAGKWVMVGQEPTTTTEKAPETSAPAVAASVPAMTLATAPSQTNTWPSLNTLVQAGILKGGDKIYLMAGYHGSISIKNLRLSPAITLAQVPGQVAHVDGIQITSSANITIRDLKVWPNTSSGAASYMIRTDASSNDITFANLDIRARADGANYLQWQATTWNTYKHSAMLLQGTRMSAIGNRLTGINHGIFASGPNGRIEGNIIDGFSGDGLRALGDNSVVRGNRVQNCFQIDANHADAFQSYSRGANGTPGTGTVYNLTIENNKFLEWVAASTNPLRCKLQGIGLFDGMYNNTVIRNNLVVVSAYHGITVLGADKLMIQQNTVVTPTGTGSKFPWISVAAHKNGTASRNAMTVNNTTNHMMAKANPTNNNIVSNNVVVTNAASEFVSVAKSNFALLPTAKSANAGANAYKTPVDIAGTPRPKGTAPDAGAYESQ